MDCLVCHDTTGTYKKAPPKAGWPDKKVNLKYVAENVGHTSRRSCGSCHFNGGGGNAIKHADMGRNLLQPDPDCDIHMGNLDFSCAECHTTRQHRIAGRSSSVAAVEGVVQCADCHSNTPHFGNKLLDHHLNKHCASIDCNTCHSPVYAKCVPTKLWWDWSQAGDKTRQPVMQYFGNSKKGYPDYHVKKGAFRWGRAVKPNYAWFNGDMQRMVLGDAANLNAAAIELARPVGSILDPKSRITPFKLMKGVQAFDVKYRTLLVPHLFPRGKDDTTAYWKVFDWDKAFADGMRSANLPYSGQFIWKETWMYWRVEHEVMPAKMALTCVNCHQSFRQEKTCDRCHRDNRQVDFKKLAQHVADLTSLQGKIPGIEALQQQSDYIDFKALGYRGDPVIYGGRTTTLPLGRSEAAPTDK